MLRNVETTFGDPGKIAFVGEAPTIGDMHRGVSFSGPGGKLLDMVLNYHGINRSEVTLTNAVPYRHEDSSAPSKTEVTDHRDALIKELSDSGVEIIVTLGNSAALSILGTEGITRLRVGPGKKSPYNGLDGVRVIPTIHPAACLRQSDNFPFLVTDIGKIEGAQDDYVEPEWTILNGGVDTIRILRELGAREEVLVVDIEVHIDKDTSFDHPDRYDLLCIGLGTERGEIYVLSESACADSEIRNQLSATLGASKLVGQNGKFDLSGLAPWLGIHELWFDTMLASYCLDERPGIHGLKHMAVELLGAPQYDAEIKTYVPKGGGYGLIPRDLLYKYNAYDIDCTLKLYLLQKKLLEKQGKPDWWDEWYPETPFLNLRSLHDFLVVCANQLMKLELAGIEINEDYIAELATEYLQSLDELKTNMQTILHDAGFDGSETFNPNSPKQVKAALMHMGIKVDSTNKETIQLVKERLIKHPVELGARDFALDYIENHQTFKTEGKLYSTYVKGLSERLYNGKVYPTFLLHGTTTGRLSCRNPNIQNVPRQSKIRDLYIPERLENVFVQSDYKQAELRILTWMAKDGYFQEILNDPNRDLFDELTPLLYPNAPTKDEIDDAAWKEYRIRVKAFVYGLGYGRTHFTIATEFKMPEAEALAVKNRFFDAIPEIKEFQDKIKRHVRDGNDLITPFGRHRRFHLITKENWKSIQNEALAFLPQSTSSDVCLRAMGRVCKDLEGSDARVRNIVHDSILVDCHRDDAKYISSMVNKHMVESAQELVGDYINFTTDTKIGKSWGEV